jgi:hypothetical protein
VVLDKLAGAQLGHRSGCVDDPVGMNDLLWRIWPGINLCVTRLSGSMRLGKGCET